MTARDPIGITRTPKTLTLPCRLQEDPPHHVIRRNRARTEVRRIRCPSGLDFVQLPNFPELHPELRVSGARPSDFVAFLPPSLHLKLQRPFALVKAITPNLGRCGR